MSLTNWHIEVGLTLAMVIGILYLVNRTMKTFFWRTTISLVPLALAGLVVANAWERYQNGEGGFKLGVDLVGGTILVYEVDVEKMSGEQKENFLNPGVGKETGVKQLASRLKRRIDPTDLYNVTIRPVSNTRVEIILPTGGAHQAAIEEQAWTDLLDKVRSNWEKLKDVAVDVPRGHQQELVVFIQQKTQAPPEEIEKFISENYKPGKERKDVTGEEVQHIKDLIAQAGSLEFRILANQVDDPDALEAARKWIDDSKNKPELERVALAGKSPLPPVPPADKAWVDPATREKTKAFTVTLKNKPHHFTYSWVELGRHERHSMGLDNAAKTDPKRVASWQSAAANRNKAMVSPEGQILLYSRECKDIGLPPNKRAEKGFEYFVLVRDPELDPSTREAKKISGDYLTKATSGTDNDLRLAVYFGFNTTGGNLFYEITSDNAPTEEGKFHRRLAIILDGYIESAPRVNQAIRNEGQITGNFTKKEVEDLVSVLRSGPLPATLKPQPVSENTMGPTLGADTIYKGTLSVGLAFAAILIFMAVYYRFAGLVACVALLANLLLTVAFMVLVSATFTLPGLAGLVLMLGMAVDANVLIYERLREELDRGASLPLAIRNGYDRAFPTIIDTHLSSIFTAIVLYAVGNDQLKGFGVSLTVGLIISLFTSLYMTRLLFDFWQARNWLHKLSMFRLFSRPNIDFMSIRYYWFTATILLTLVGISVFIWRLPQDLNIDFVGGTAYGGQLNKATDIGTLRKLLEDGQKERLQVVNVKEVAAEKEWVYDITYRNPDGKETTRAINFPNPPAGNNAQEREKDVLNRAKEMPDLSLEQIFPADDPNSRQGKSRFFTVRTSEKAPDLVQASIAQLLGDLPVPGQEQRPALKRILLSSFNINKNNKEATLEFKDPEGKEEVYASPAQVTMLLEREFKRRGITQQPTVQGEGKSNEGRFEKMKLSLSEPVNPPNKLQEALQATQTEFSLRPQPDRLENFDSQLADEMKSRAMYAVLASWLAILLYLWFRFKSWTFGMAAVLCLIHDLFFTMGIIAFCHYLHGTWFGNLLGLEDFKIDLPAVAALLTLVGYSTNDTIVVFDRIREVRGKNPDLTPQMINDSVNQTLSRTLLTSFATWLVVIVLYVRGGEGVHLFAFCMVVGVIVGTYSSIYIASPLLLIFGEGKRPAAIRASRPEPVGAPG